MAGVILQLGPKQSGAELLAKIAQGRRSGVLRWGGGTEERLHFREGRPEMLQGGQGHTIERKEVVTALRRFALRTAGTCSFEPSGDHPAAKLGVDTLGEVLLAILGELPAAQAEAFIQARCELPVDAAPSFARLTSAIQQLGGPRLEAPSGPATLAALTADKSLDERRAWIAALVLGGLRSTEPAPVAAPADHAAPIPAAAPGTKELPSIPPTHQADTPLFLEIEQAYAKVADQSHYDFLGVARDVDAGALQKAYFSHAKRWHSDRFANTSLSPPSLEKAAELFRRAEEANGVLSKPEERSSYDFVLDRRAKGLPTDPKVIFHAEGLFRKAQALVRRGQGAAAEPILREAVDLNKGEAEFWVFLGYAIFSSKGQDGVKEAKELIQKGLAMNAKLDSAHEFLGRIARVEGDSAEAHRRLQQALKLNPKNVEAERELRLIAMRDEAKPKRDAGGLGALFGKMLKR